MLRPGEQVLKNLPGEVITTALVQLQHTVVVQVIVVVMTNHHKVNLR